MRRSCPSPADSRITVIRPFLGVFRETIHQWAKSERLKWREDSSNTSIRIQRNRVRHRLLPALRRNFGDGLQTRLPRLMDILAEESECLSMLAMEWVMNPDRSEFAKLPVAMQRRTLQCQLLRLETEVDFDLIETLRFRPDVTISIGKDHWIKRTEAGMVEEIKGDFGRFRAEKLQLNLKKGDGTVAIGAITLIWRIAQSRGDRFNPQPMTEYFDAEKVGDIVLLRFWRPGDRYQPIGLDRARKLQDIFSDLKIPRERRGRLVVAQAQNGEIFWVQGLRVAERFKLDKGTRQRLKWNWRAVDGP